MRYLSLQAKGEFLSQLAKRHLEQANYNNEKNYNNLRKDFIDTLIDIKFLDLINDDDVSIMLEKTFLSCELCAFGYFKLSREYIENVAKSIKLYYVKF